MSDLPRRPLSADDTLPPVEPPNAGFLVQLFLVPAVIVGIIVCVYLAFYWLAHLGNDPQASLKALQRNTEGRWHAALNFANDLRGRDGARLKNDPALATQLAAILDAEVASGRPRLTTDGGEQARTLCGYLCRALGEFAVPEAAAPLLARIADPGIPQVAQAAVEAIAVLAENLHAANREFPDPAAVSAALLAASRTEDAALRSRAAYSIGVAAGDDGNARLRELLVDQSDNVRYNAAVGLARRGDVAAWETLGEMLALPDIAAAPGDEEAQASRYKRVVIVVNALRGAGLLIDAGRVAPAESIVTAIAVLEKDPAQDVREAATALRLKIGRLTTRGGKTAETAAP
ncbi:hypothetical protein LBMAG47_08560 [Planctomycetia bacterium]|jgi:HEAT repeat protein|nr:hypothetical protein LBMAG47_08560 [Planctomycetia bacterium]